MAEQSYANHARWVPPYHFVASALLLVALIGEVINLVRRVQQGGGRILAVSVILLTLAVLIIWLYSRTFATRAQDRAIRAEESLRHYQLTGKPIDPRLTLRQVIALRFAPDAELPELTRRACEENLGARDIKQAIKNWRGDHERV